MAQLTVAEKMRMARARAQLSLDQMAHSISTLTGDTISRETVRRFEKGVASPDLATLEAVAEISELSFGWLVGVSLVCADPGQRNLIGVNPIEQRVNSLSDRDYALKVFGMLPAAKDLEPKSATVIGSPSLFERYVDLTTEKQAVNA